VKAAAFAYLSSGGELPLGPVGHLSPRFEPQGPDGASKDMGFQKPAGNVIQPWGTKEIKRLEPLFLGVQ